MMSNTDETMNINIDPSLEEYLSRFTSNDEFSLTSTNIIIDRIQFPRK